MEAASLFNQAEEKFRHLLEIKPDKHIILFNLGCLAGLRSDVEQVVITLKKWKEKDPKASKSALDNDKDFDLVRDDPRFKTLRDSLTG